MDILQVTGGHFDNNLEYVFEDQNGFDYKLRRTDEFFEELLTTLCELNDQEQYAYGVLSLEDFHKELDLDNYIKELLEIHDLDESVHSKKYIKYAQHKYDYLINESKFIDN